MPDDLRLGNTAVPPFLPPHPARAPLAPDTRRAPPPLRCSPLGEAAERAGARGREGTKVKGEGGPRPGPFEPCRWPWGNPARPSSAARVLPLPAGRPWFARLPGAPFPFGGKQWAKLPVLGWGAPGRETAASQGGGVGLRLPGRGVPVAGAAQEDAVVPPGPGSPRQGPDSRGF